MTCFALLLTACTGGGGTSSEDVTTSSPDTTAAETAEITSIPEETTEEPSEPVVRKLVLGGGGAGAKTYKAAFSLVDKKNPKCIVLCTAGRDTVENIESYTGSMRAYTKNIEAIALSTHLYTEDELREKILSADLILVGGGQSEYMMSTWQQFGVDKLLIEAYNKGIVCFGGSAGGMCWTYAGWNDFYGLPDSTYKFFYGLDVLNVYYGPHYSNSALWAQFDVGLRRETSPKYNVGYAMENGTALVFIDGKVVKSIRENGNEKIYQFDYANGKWNKSEFAYID
ncbi:MAG: Type 1 glutamine amidotransferase-like domain-containing protein [Clostridia bacterium]|nr:Type 1 glutamine amidotransferase-like domain-containing protein [Clostridia bacterium]